MPKSKHRRRHVPVVKSDGFRVPDHFVVPVPVADKATRKILIAIPCHSGAPSYATQIACANSSREADPLGWEVVQMIRATDSILIRARDVLLSSFWASDCTDMLFVDSDIGWDPGVFTKIMRHERDQNGNPVELVGGVYTARGDTPDYVVRTLDRSINVQYPSGLAEVRGVATGFMRITRAAMARMVEAFPDDWYRDERTAPGLKIYHLFDFIFDRNAHELYSEDYVFCDRFRALGGKVYADVDLTLHHAGQKIWTGNFGEFLRQGGSGRNPITAGVPVPNAPAGISVMPEMPVLAQAPIGVSLLDTVRALVKAA